MKRLIALFLVLIFMFSLTGCGGKAIGTISGVENEKIVIGNMGYILDTSCDFSHADKGAYLGKVSNASLTMRVYSVKGDNEGEYIYALWDWEGAFYKKVGN